MTERRFDLADNQDPNTVPLTTSRADTHWYKLPRCGYLFVKVTHRNRRWAFRQTQDGLEINQVLGNLDLFGENEARIMALQVARNLQEGVLPPTIAERRRQLKQQRLTVEKAFLAYHRDHLAFHAKSADELMKEFNRYWSGIRKVRVASLDPSRVRSWLNSISEQGTRQATFYKQQNLLKACLKWCGDNGLVPSNLEDPTRGIKKKKDNQNINYLKKEDFHLLLDALSFESDDTKDVVLMLLHTAQRKSNVFQMQWSEINWDQRTWTIPQEKTKTSRQYPVPLIDDALEILKERRGNGSLYVFPTNDKSSNHPHIATIQHAWNRIRNRLAEKAAYLATLRPHDLRHTRLTWEAQSGASAYEVQRIGNHSNINTSSRYVHLDTEQIRQRMNDTQQRLAGNCSDVQRGPRVIHVAESAAGRKRRGYSYEIK